ncbi:MAG: 3-methyl-2-oxobutanoate hydroxymethyltransferase [Akkermansiaceae bacterium]|jgi:3-methyl-2-oxobutanoate hydroxymethyltransferase|nr:3-methyl-2-oxobutanoate hydroxymethyltransferase [Akkermansiaceae bacterium]
MRKKPTVKDLFDLKGKRQLTQVFVENTGEALASEEAGIDMIVAMGDITKACRAVAPTTFITGAISYGECASPTEAIRRGFEIWEAGADAIYACMPPDWVREMAHQGLPVVGHVGLVPQKRTWLGGFKAQGKTAASAMRIYRDTLAFQDAGAIGVEMEVVPERVASEIAKRVDILVISMGAGPQDVQYLFASDILGTHTGHYPRHAKKYCDLHAERARLHRMSVDALRSYGEDVASGGLFQPERIVPIQDEEFEKFMDCVDRP